jgi:hypothetical protein
VAQQQRDQRDRDEAPPQPRGEPQASGDVVWCGTEEEAYALRRHWGSCAESDARARRLAANGCYDPSDDWDRNEGHAVEDEDSQRGQRDCDEAQLQPRGQHHPGGSERWYRDTDEALAQRRHWGSCAESDARARRLAANGCYDPSDDWDRNEGHAVKEEDSQRGQRGWASAYHDEEWDPREARAYHEARLRLQLAVMEERHGHDEEWDPREARAYLAAQPQPLPRPLQPATDKEWADAFDDEDLLGMLVTRDELCRRRGERQGTGDGAQPPPWASAYDDEDLMGMLLARDEPCRRRSRPQLCRQTKAAAHDDDGGDGDDDDGGDDDGDDDDDDSGGDDDGGGLDDDDGNDSASTSGETVPPGPGHSDRLNPVCTAPSRGARVYVTLGTHLGGTATVVGPGEGTFRGKTEVIFPDGLTHHYSKKNLSLQTPRTTTGGGGTDLEHAAEAGPNVETDQSGDPDGTGPGGQGDWARQTRATAAAAAEPDPQPRPGGRASSQAATTAEEDLGAAWGRGHCEGDERACDGACERLTRLDEAAGVGLGDNPERRLEDREGVDLGGAIVRAVFGLGSNERQRSGDSAVAHGALEADERTMEPLESEWPRLNAAPWIKGARARRQGARGGAAHA